MNVAIFSRVLFLSGVTTHIIDLTHELAKRGHHIYVFTRGPDLPDKKENMELAERLVASGAEIVKINFPKSSKHLVDYAFSLIVAMPKVVFMLKKKKIDIIHVHTPALSLPISLLGKKFVKTIHTKDLSLSILNCKATHEIAVSSVIYIEAKEKFKYKENELSLIFNGVDLRFSNLALEKDKFKIKERLGLPHDKVIIGIVGSIQHRKGHDILIKAFSLLEDKLKKASHLVILGDGGSIGTDWINQLINQYRLEKFVSVFGFQNPKPFYDVMNIFVLPSRMAEGFGLVVAEAALSGCCVARSDVEGAYDQVEDGETGFLFENENTEQLTGILKKLIEDKELRENVAKKGRSFALVHFTADKMAEKTLEVYEKIINR